MVIKVCMHWFTLTVTSTSNHKHIQHSLALSLSLSNSFSFFLCFVVICLTLWSQPGSGPRISPQRHNYHTGLNVPPTSYSTHQRPSIPSPTLFSSDAFDLSLSIISMFHSHTLPACSSSIPYFSLSPAHSFSPSWCAEWCKMTSLVL